MQVYIKILLFVWRESAIMIVLVALLAILYAIPSLASPQSRRSSWWMNLVVLLVMVVTLSLVADFERIDSQLQLYVASSFRFVEVYLFVPILYLLAGGALVGLMLLADPRRYNSVFVFVVFFVVGLALAGYHLLWFIGRPYLLGLFDLTAQDIPFVFAGPFLRYSGAFVGALGAAGLVMGAWRRVNSGHS